MSLAEESPDSEDKMELKEELDVNHPDCEHTSSLKHEWKLETPKAEINKTQVGEYLNDGQETPRRRCLELLPAFSPGQEHCGNESLGYCPDSTFVPKEEDQYVHTTSHSGQTFNLWNKSDGDKSFLVITSEAAILTEADHTINQIGENGNTDFSRHKVLAVYERVRSTDNSSNFGSSQRVSRNLFLLRNQINGSLESNGGASLDGLLSSGVGEGAGVQFLGRLGADILSYGDEETWACDVCGLDFKTYQDLKQHKTVYREGIYYKCDICGKTMINAFCLKRHRRVHTGERPFKCDICGDCFTDAWYLSVHVRKHTGETPYRCGVCGAGFRRAVHLENHHICHTGLKPYLCHICGRCFARPEKLTRHIMVHTGEKPYMCDVCGAGFIQAGGLRTHKKTHSGERLYTCASCDLCFTMKKSWKLHEKMHLAETTEKLTGGVAKAGDSVTCRNNLAGRKPGRNHKKCAPTNSDNVRKCRVNKRQVVKVRQDSLGTSCYNSNLLQYKSRRRSCAACQDQPLPRDTRNRVRGQNLLCDLCGISFRQFLQLKIHISRHVGLQPTTCRVCSRVKEQTARSFSVCRPRMRQNCSCDLCGLVCTEFDLMNIHVRKHIEE